MSRATFYLRQKSLARGNVLVFAGIILSLPLSHFPHLQQNPWLIVPTLLIALGTAETFRNIERRWSFYHAGVILCIYMDLMALFLVLFFLICPYLALGAYVR
ncbi:MAG: permease [Acidobacteriaceae bacterium]|nr:permease [Acidobacteriaceae bacterium]